MFGDVACGVGFYEKVEKARLVVAGDGCVATEDFFGGAIGLGESGCDRDVLPNRQTENSSW